MNCYHLELLIDNWIDSLGKSEFKVAAYLYRVAADGPGLTVYRPIRAIAEAIDLSERQVGVELKKLEAKGLILESGVNRSGRRKAKTWKPRPRLSA